MILPPRIALVGFMGSGKTTVGRLLAAKTAYAFLDTDDEIEADAGMKISEIFRLQGERAFRERERNAVRQVLERESIVIATGGGAFAQAGCADMLMARAVVVHLDCDFSAAFRRVELQGGRPLVERGEIAAAALYAERKDKYARSHVAVETTHRSPEEIADEIVERVRGVALSRT